MASALPTARPTSAAARRPPAPPSRRSASESGRRARAGEIGRSGRPCRGRPDPKLPGVRIRELLEPLGVPRPRRSSTTTCARCARCLPRRPGRFSARSIGPGRSASSTSGSRRRGPRRARTDATRMGCRRVPGLQPGGRRGAGLLARDTGSLAGIAGRASGAPGRPAAAAALGSAGGHPRPRRSADRRVRRVLRAVEGRLGLLRAGRPADQRGGRAAAGLRGEELRARPALRQRDRLPRPARRLVFEGQRRTHKTLRTS